MRYSLYLYPVSPKASDESARSLRQKLKELEIAGKMLDKDHYAAGPRLMEYITYLGCSPSLSSGDIESSLRIHVFDRITALGGLSVEVVRYPRCKHPVADVPALLSSYSSQANWQCPECGHQGSFEQINWRKSAGFSSLFLEISAIFPKEAIPGDNFLNELHQLSDCNWSWFYSRSTDED